MAWAGCPTGTASASGSRSPPRRAPATASTSSPCPARWRSAQELPVRTVSRRGLGLKLAVFAGNTTVALLLISVTWNAAAVAAVPLFIVLLYTAYRGYLTVDEDRDTWRGLEEATKALAELDPAAVARQAIAHAAGLLRADAAEVFVRQGDATVGRYLAAAAGETEYAIFDESVLPAMDLVSGAVTSSVHHHDSVDGLPFTLAVPLEANRRNLGALRLGFRGECPADRAASAGCC